MKKNLLFIQGIYDTIDLFIASFAAAFEEFGCFCHIIDIREKETAMKDLKKLLEEQTLDAVVTFNNIGYNLSFSDGATIWEAQGIPFFNILMDHPFHYDRALLHAPSTSVVFATDRNHVGYLRRFYPKLARVDFIPHAGMEADITKPAQAGDCHLCGRGGGYHPAMEERPIEVLYAGGLSKYVAEGLVPDLGEITEFDAFALTKEVLCELMNHPHKTTEQAIEEYLISIGRKYEDGELCRWITNLRFIDSYAASYYREQAVRLLAEAGIPVTVFGGGWDCCEWADNPNLIYGGKVLAPQVLELMNHAKIVLNTMTWYKNGIHDRIINGMLAKSLVVTDGSAYLEEEMAEQKSRCLEMFALPQIEALPGRVEELLRRPEEMEEIAQNGYCYARERHTWGQRAKYILEHYLR